MKHWFMNTKCLTSEQKNIRTANRIPFQNGAFASETKSISFLRIINSLLTFVLQLTLEDMARRIEGCLWKFSALQWAEFRSWTFETTKIRLKAPKLLILHHRLWFFVDILEMISGDHSWIYKKKYQTISDSTLSPIFQSSMELFDPNLTRTNHRPKFEFLDRIFTNNLEIFPWANPRDSSEPP